MTKLAWPENYERITNNLCAKFRYENHELIARTVALKSKPKFSVQISSFVRLEIRRRRLNSLRRATSTSNKDMKSTKHEQRRMARNEYHAYIASFLGSVLSPSWHASLLVSIGHTQSFKLIRSPIAYEISPLFNLHANIVCSMPAENSHTEFNESSSVLRTVYSNRKRIRSRANETQ